MGEVIYAEHPEGCSLQLFYRTSPCKKRGSTRSAMGVIRLPPQIVVWVGLFSRNTQRDVPYLFKKQHTLFHVKQFNLQFYILQLLYCYGKIVTKLKRSA